MITRILRLFCKHKEIVEFKEEIVSPIHGKLWTRRTFFCKRCGERTRSKEGERITYEPNE